jgi:hypothetical protein
MEPNGNKSLTSPPPSNGQSTPSPVTVTSRYQPWSKPETPLPLLLLPDTAVVSVGVNQLIWPKLVFNRAKQRYFCGTRRLGIIGGRIRSSPELTLGGQQAQCHLSACTFVDSPTFRFADAFRAEMQDRGLFVKAITPDVPNSRGGRPKHTAIEAASSASRLIAAFESEVRCQRVHNPVSRSQVGTAARAKLFKWVLLEGIWVKNPTTVSTGPETRPAVIYKFQDMDQNRTASDVNESIRSIKNVSMHDDQCLGLRVSDSCMPRAKV